jgi:DnaJ-class molecular chaperone
MCQRKNEEVVLCPACHGWGFPKATDNSLLKDFPCSLCKTTGRVIHITTLEVIPFDDRCPKEKHEN